MWIEALFASIVFRNWYNDTVQPLVRTVLHSGIEAGADGSDGQCGDTQESGDEATDWQGWL